MRYKAYMLGSDTRDEDEIVDSNIEVKPHISDVAEALDTIARRCKPLRYWASTVLFLTMSSCVVFSLVSPFFIPQKPRGEFGLFQLYMTVMVFVFIPWIRHRVAALFFKWTAPGWYTEYVITRFSRDTLSTLEGGRKIEVVLGDFPIRFETKRTFAFARANTSFGFAVPKRAFSDPSLIAEFRRIFEAPAPPASVVAAVRTLGADAPTDTVTFTPEFGEAMRGLRLMIGVAWYRVGQTLLFTMMALGLGYIFLRDGPVVGGVFMLVLLFVAMRVVARAKSRRASGELSTTIELGDIVRRRSVAGTGEWRWADLHGLVEDDEVVVLLVRSRAGLCIPKRSLTAEMLALIRSRVPAQQ